MSYYNEFLRLPDIKTAAGRLKEKINNEITLTPMGIRRFEEKIKPINILRWLSTQASSTKIYWRSRDEKFEVGGIGQSRFSQSFDEALNILPDLDPAIVCFGGSCFDPMRVRDTTWSSFPAIWFSVPVIEIFYLDYCCMLACNVDPGDILSVKRVNELLNQLDYSHSQEPSNTVVLYRSETPNKDKWFKIVEKALTQIKTGILSKVVLARHLRFEVSKPINPWMVLDKLKENSDLTYLFGIQPNTSSTFISATPERLFKRDELDFESEAVAGTTSRGKTLEEDIALGNELLNSDKDRREQQLVTNYIKDALTPKLDKLTIDEAPSVFCLPHLKHLRTKIKGNLRKGVSDIEILNSLHPTPAVAGTPLQQAVTFIRENEPFDRGWYAGPIGFMGKDISEFAVGIRSMLIDDNLLILTAGAGIVDGSSAEKEWNEIENKISSILDVVFPS